MNHPKNLARIALLAGLIIMTSVFPGVIYAQAPSDPAVPIYENGWFIIGLSTTVVISLLFFFKNFTSLRIENFESYTSQNELIVKIRVLSILSILLFPLAEYYEGVYLKLYPANWLPIILITAVALVSLALSFRKTMSFAFASFLPQISYYTVYGLILVKCLAAGMLPIMAIEVACLILFSKLIFTKLRSLLYFILFIALVNIVSVNFFSVPEINLDIHISATIQACIVSTALFLIEGTYNRKVGFGNKVLESSSLYILVSNENASFVYANEILEKVTGLNQNEILGEGWWNYLNHDPETTASLKKLVSDSIKGNRNSQYENTIKDRNGNIVYVEWENTVIEEKFLLAVGRNVTEAKLLQMEENRRKEKASRYSQAISSMTIAPHAEANNLQDTLRIIVKKASEALGTDRVSIWYYEKNRLLCEAMYVASSNQFYSGAVLEQKKLPLYFEAIGSGKIVHAQDVYKSLETVEFIKEYFPLNKIKSLLDIPIFINGELHGVLCLEQTVNIQQWDNEDVGFARSIADFVALSIENYKRRDLEREYRYILNNAGDIIYTTDGLGNFVFINKTATKLLGYDPDAVKGKHFTSIIDPEYRERTALFYLRQFKKKTESTYLEFKVLNAEGKSYWVGQNVKLITEKDDPDKVKGFQAVVRDINKQKEAEAALLNSENNFRQINENINEVFYLYNFERKKYDYISPNCFHILGASDSFFYEGKNYYEHFLAAEDQERINELNRDGRNKNEYDIEFKVVVNNHIRWIRERSFPIRDAAGRVIKKSGVCSDITEKKQQEAQLRELSMVAQSVSNGIVITSAEGLIEWCNQSFLDMLEYTLDEVKGKRPIETFSGPQTSGESREEILKSRLENGSIELLQYSKSGVPKWVLITNTPLLNEKGMVIKYIEIVTDITERKALEREYRHILNNAGDIIYTTNELGYIAFLNESVQHILGYPPEELIGKHFSHIIHPEDKKKVSLFYLKQFAQRVDSTYNEFRVVSKKGEVYWVGQNVKLITDMAASNKVKGFQSILRDITRQKEAEVALTESEKNFRQISETISDVFYLYNLKEDKYEYMSPNAIDILGVDTIYFYYVNNFLEDYVISKDREIVKEAYDKIREGIPFEIEFRVTIDQEIRWLKEKSFIIRSDDGKVHKVSGTYIDITQKKMQEKRLLKINKELSLYSEDLEINNLLKEQLIYTNSFEEIAKVALNTLKVKIKDIGRVSLLMVNDEQNSFDAYYLERDEVRKNTLDFSDIKAYPSLAKGKRFIEYNIDLAPEKSRSDLQRRKENIISYIALPINYSNVLTGALVLGFEKPFGLSRREIDMLENFTSVLSVVVNKLSLQKELSEKSKDILASLNYAHGIQQSILPNIVLHKDAIKSFMRLYMPKDVVSGDFYVVDSFDEYTLIALGDCTGHGVPGAFLTMLGSNFLQRIAIENKVTSPSQILELMDYQLFTMLNRNRQETIRDGMELGVCIYDRKKKTLAFSGAGLFLAYFRNNEQIIINGSKRSIGDDNHARLDFIETTIELNGSEKFYMFSDGYRDQLGGPERRKRFSRARFFELLNKIKNLPPFQQEYILKMEHQKYKGKLKQTDDISVIGFELK